MYQALYRKWRPQTFDEVVGQKHITETLKNQVISGRFSHAYIFIGSRGTGKTTCARILAKAVNCENPVNGNPCGCCPSCLGIADGSVLDIVEMDAASNNKVDDVRALREEAVFSPAAVKKRVYIIDEVHMLTTSAFNALLKILEEPPEHLMFILATTELQKVPATILSRCQRHTFKRLESGVLSEYITYVAKKEGFDIRSDGAELIARLAEGGVRDALSLLDQCSAKRIIDSEAVYEAMGLAGNRRIAELLELILSDKLEAALRSFNEMWMDGKAPYTVMSELSTLLRDVLMMRVSPKGCRDIISGSYDVAALTGFAEKLTPESASSMLMALQQAMISMRDAQSPKTLGELCIVSLCRGEDRGTDYLAARLARLENKVKSLASAPPVQPVKAVPMMEIPEEFEDEVRAEPAQTPVCEDDIDPEQFREEQPEDAVFAQKGSSEAPAEDAIPEFDDIELWNQIRVSPLFPQEQKRLFVNRADAYGEVNGDLVTIYAEPYFSYARFNRPAAMAAIEKAACAVAGKPMRVKLVAMQAQGEQTRDISEIYKYPEVQIVN